MLNVVCLNVSDYLGHGALYVDNLYRAVRKHLSLRHEFYCFCDHATPISAYDQRVHLIQRLPPGLTGWWNKMALFREGTFGRDDRVLYLDLDTVITGSLDDIASYDGRFAMLEDVLYPGQWGSGIMAWRGDFGHKELWQPFERALSSCKLSDLGDQGFIMEVGGMGGVDPDLLQDLYPRQIQSYKREGGVLWPDTRAVAFHGLPRPHEVPYDWVPHFWNGHTA